MAKIVKVRLVKIGNSQGIRIPKTLVEQYALRGEVELEAESDRLIVRASTTRQGWDLHFERMAAAGDDRMLDGDVMIPTRWDAGEWEW
jgi:antitoxin MazE